MATDTLVDYGGLTVERTDGQRHAELKSDVQEDAFNGNLAAIVSRVYSVAYANKLFLLKRQGIGGKSIYDLALAYAQNYVTAAAKIIGNAYDTQNIVQAELSNYPQW